MITSTLAQRHPDIGSATSSGSNSTATSPSSALAADPAGGLARRTHRTARVSTPRARVALAQPSVPSAQPFDDPALQAIDQALQQGYETRARNLAMQTRIREAGFGRADTMRLVDRALRLPLSNEMRQALTLLPHFDPNAPVEPHGRTLLVVASELNDHAFAKHLLALGAKAEKLPPQADSKMQNLVRAVDDVRKLYPSGLPPDATDIDRALLSFDFRQALQLLEAGRNGRTDRQMWEDSVGTDTRPDREDVRRGMLVVGYRHGLDADSMAAVMFKVGFKTSSKPTMDLLKTLGYHSPDREIVTSDTSGLPQPLTDRAQTMVGLMGGAPIDHNMKVAFPDTGDGKPKVMRCQEISATWIDGLDGDGKFDYSRFRTPEAMQQNVPSKATWETPYRYPLSPRANLTLNAEWGERLADEFRDMESRGEKLRPLEIVSSHHLMGTALKIKNKPADNFQTKYVVKTFDPMVTVGHKRAASLGDLGAIERLHFAHMMPTLFHNDTAFKGEASPSVLSFDPPPPGWKDNLPPKALSDRGRRLDEPWTGPIDSPTLQRLVKNGFEGDLSDMEARIRATFDSLPREQGIALLQAKGALGPFGLHAAVQSGQACTVEWYCSFLTKLNLARDESRTLVAQTGPDIDPMLEPITLAITSGEWASETAKAVFQHALPLLHRDDALQALDGRLTNGTPAVAVMLSKMNDVTFELYCAAAHHLGMPEDMKRRILTDGGLPVMPNAPQFLVFARFEPSVRQAYGELVSALGMAHDPAVQQVLNQLDQLPFALADIEQQRLTRSNALELPIRDMGSDADRARRKDLRRMLDERRQAEGLTSTLDVTVAIRQTANDIIMVDWMDAERAFLKYDGVPHKQALIQQALMQFNDPAMPLDRHGDDGFSYALHSAQHGPCRVEFQFAGNVVTELRVRHANGDTLAAMRPSAA
jgi:hypothetical protein